MKNIVFALSILFFAIGCGDQNTGLQSTSRDDGEGGVTPSIDSGGQGGRRIDLHLTVDVTHSSSKRGGSGTARRGPGTAPQVNRTPVERPSPESCPSQPCVAQNRRSSGDMVTMALSKVDILFYLGHQPDGNK